MDDPTEPQAVHTEAGEGLTEAEREALIQSKMYDRDPERHVHLVEQIIRDRQADLEAVCHEHRLVFGAEARALLLDIRAALRGER